MQGLQNIVRLCREKIRKAKLEFGYIFIKCESLELYSELRVDDLKTLQYNQYVLKPLKF